MSRIDLNAGEKLIPLSQAARLPWMRERSNGKPLATTIFYRWVSKGRDGVKLAAIDAGGVLCTTEGAMRAFFLALTERTLGADSASQESRPDTTSDADAHDRATRELQLAGIA